MALLDNVNAPIRCHLFSFLFFAVFIYLLEKTRIKDSKVIYLLPILVIIWNNLHGGVIAGFGLIILYTIGEFLNKKSFKKYIITGLISLFVLMINPWGIEYVKFLLMANTMQRPDVMEWFSIFHPVYLFAKIQFKIFIILILGIETISIIKMKKQNNNLVSLWQKIDKTKYIMLFVTLYLAISHVKLLPFFVISGAAYCYEDFEIFAKNKSIEFAEKFCKILVIICCIFGITSKYVKNIPLGAKVYPHREVEFIKINELKGNILVNFGLGSFVSYKLYPQNKIFMDGRYEEVYGEDLAILLRNYYLLEKNWDEILVKYPTDIIIVERMYRVSDKLLELPNWVKVYETKDFRIFIKKDLQKEKYIQPTNDLKYYKDTLFDTSIKF